MKLLKKFFYAIVFASFLVTSIGVQPVYAASIVVTSNADTVANDGACTLREAIINANNDNTSGSTDCSAGAGTDTISFDANYTITLVGSQLPDITSQITIMGNGVANTIIQANAAPNTATYRVFLVNIIGNLTLDSLTVRHGRCNGSCSIFVTSAGGILNFGTLTVTNSRLSENSATASGGGIGNLGIVTVANSTLSGNSTTGNGGGIMHSGGIVTVTSSILSGNSAGDGGGIYNNGIITATNSTFSSNSATASGGGIYSSNSSTSLTITNSTFYNNSATFQGGGIYNYVISPSGFVMRNSTLSNNSAGNNGGGIILLPSTNSQIYNSIIANSTSQDCFAYGGASLTITNSIFEDATCSAPLSGDPNLGSIANNGGSTQTMRLNTGSSAINTGDSGTCESTDQRGVSRPQGAGCDIGAFEVDDTFPTVVSDSLVASYASGAGPNSFTVTFSENVYDPSGDTDDRDVTYLDNYLLVEDGVNGVFDTTSCEGGLEIDDTQITVTSVTYNAGLFTVTVNLDSAVPNGSYRLFVCGTTSINDLALNELNNGLTDYTFDFVVGTAVVTVPPVTASSLPDTGFAPNRITALPHQPAELSYTKMGDIIWLEIPSQNIKSNIVGIPQSEDNTWDVTWLGSDTGWLNGTAFPTWNGNSVLTAHVTDSNGLPGPFANVKELKYGDQIIVHLFGQQYIYEVQNSRMTRPQSTSFAFESMQDYSYLTLITCQGYIPFSDTYFFRRVVRAVLVDVK